MSWIPLRAAVATAAAAALVAGALFLAGPGRAGEPLGAILDRASADTLHLRLTRGGSSAEAWASGRKLRLGDGPTYRIADGDRSWLVDEKASKATPAPSPFFPEGSAGLDVLSLLDLPADADRAALRGAKPERITRDGVKVDLYRATAGGVELEAAADAATGRLLSLSAKRDGKAVEVAVLGVGEKVADEKFALKPTLSEDGRAGKVTDAQGVVTVRPAAGERWTPARADFVLKPGDTLRTDPRGANAAALRLLPRTGVVVGPGTLLEVDGPAKLRITQGEAEVAASEKAPVELTGPDGKAVTVTARAIYRVVKEQLVSVAREPAWLKGFKGTANEEAVGSLVATVDGRAVPLSVGYHKVTVDIRDQIARTVIEESFVNHTNVQTEGVFYFPLPQDASISGFAMQVGSEMVEADVVEKQRARQIYDIIKSERRDPGLLEWNGGNVFSARVWPIFPNAEKRVRITYTQVLPLTGDRFRYSYALQSEMLQSHPLRELSLDVRVSSAAPIKAISCPSHPAKLEKTAHSARISFTATEYTPARDFEAVVELDGARPEAVLLPHRRGDDGYFMLQLTPPSAAAERPLVPDGPPLHLLILADTSASMTRSQRAAQDAVVAALLASLGPKDTFNLAACDVECDWRFDAPVAASAEKVFAARNFLTARSSLGWTDLDKAFASVLARCQPGTVVVYLGDGSVTAGDGDPIAFAQRLRKKHSDAGSPGTFHAVAVGSTFEPGVMNAIGSLGGGSFRRVGGDLPPASAAAAVLNEAARPALRDLKVEFRGVKVAAVYPERLPNLPEGTQQVVLGRFQPTGKDQAGEAVVTGTRGGKPFTFTARLDLKEGEEGNAFVPRLWARMHLDKLLEGGSSASVKDDVISLSEEFNIITPYTSLLVLESDADRERFGVKRRFKMRDGENFFADGREKADFELRQKAIKRAGDWRVGLRNSALARLATLGRTGFGDERRRAPGHNRPTSLAPGLTGSWGEMDGVKFDVASDKDAYFTHGFGLGLDMREFDGKKQAETELIDRLDEKLGVGDDQKDLAVEKKELAKSIDDSPDGGDLLPVLAAPIPLANDFEEPLLRNEMQQVDRRAGIELARPFGSVRSKLGAFRQWGYERGELASKQRSSGRNTSWDVTQWLDPVFPGVPDAPKPPVDIQSVWPEAARALARSLSRVEKLRGLKGGFELTRQYEGMDVPRGKLLNRSLSRGLYSPSAWLIRTAGDAEATRVEWCDADGRGAWLPATGTARVRAATPADRELIPLWLPDWTLGTLERTHHAYSAETKDLGAGKALLTLTPPMSGSLTVRFEIDTRRGVVLSREYLDGGKRWTRTEYGDFVEAAGGFWPRSAETKDGQGRTQSAERIEVRELDADTFARLTKEARSGLADALTVRLPLPKLLDARRAVEAGKDTFADRYALLLEAVAGSQFTRAFEHLAACEKLAVGKAGLGRLRDATLGAARRNEELRTRIQEQASRLAREAGEPGDDMARAEELIAAGVRVLGGNEVLALYDTLKPVYDRQPGYRPAVKVWTRQRANWVRSVGRADEFRTALARLAADYPDDADLQREYATALSDAGDAEAALAWLKKALAPERKWSASERDGLRMTWSGVLENAYRFGDQAEFLSAWIAEGTDSSDVFARYLGALVRSGKAEKADEMAAKWLAERPAIYPRAYAAAYYALGQGHGISTSRLGPVWIAPLADAAGDFARSDSALVRSVARILVNSSEFRATDEARKVRRALAEELLAKAAGMPLERLEEAVGMALDFESALKPDELARLADLTARRWSDEADPAAKHRLGAVVHRVTLARDPEAVLDFLRTQYRNAPQGYEPSYARDLFAALLGRPWSLETEAEAFALLDKLTDSADPAERERSAAEELMTFVNRSLAARAAAAVAKIAEPEKLSRTELATKRAEAVKAAREGVRDRLAVAKPSPALAPWVTAERQYLDAVLGHEPKRLAEELLRSLGEPPAGPEAEVPEGQELATALATVRRERTLTTLAYLATRKEPAIESAVLIGWLERAAKAQPEQPGWKGHLFLLLAALDRPQPLEKAVAAWHKADDPDGRWRSLLGHLLAEQGRIDEAITLFEAAPSLPASDWQSLAEWYLVTGQRDKHTRAKVETWKGLDEYTLSRWLSARLYPYERQGTPPPEMDADVPVVFAAVFEKANRPGDYLDLLRRFYGHTKDFRLLAGLADAIPGQTAEKVYPFLSGMTSVLNEVRDEATVDEFAKRIDVVRKAAKTAVDRRALDLLESLVRRRAAELKNPPGPHADAALSALKRAGKDDWQPGEARHMAEFLAGLGAIPQKPLAEEQVRQLEALHAAAARGTEDRLAVATALARTRQAYGKIDDAVALLLSALDERRAAADGKLPASAEGELSLALGWLESARQHARAEEVVAAEVKRAADDKQAARMTRRLLDVWHDALRQDQTVSVGKGEALYKALTARLAADVDTPEHDARYQAIERLYAAYRTAAEKKVGSPAGDLKAFVAGPLMVVLRKPFSQYESAVTRTSEALRDLAGAEAAVAFLLDRCDDEPAWRRLAGQDSWSRQSYNLAHWRQEVKLAAPVAGRLLARVLAELRRDLETQEYRNRYICHANYSFYWSEKEADFAAVAEEVLKGREDNSRAVIHIAEYLHDGLNRRKRGIAVLQAARAKKLLDENSESRLAHWLTSDSRPAEALAVLEPLAERRPDTLDYRVRVMDALHALNRDDDVAARLTAADKYLREKKRADESALAALAFGSARWGRHEQAVAYFKEVIPLRRKRAEDGTLSDYQIGLSRSLAELGRTAEAVDAASEAVVLWGRNLDQRNRALDAVRNALRRCPDLAAYAATLDKQTAETGLVNVVVRKALGQVYAEKDDYPAALAQLQLAAGADPNDAEVLAAIVTVHDKSGNKEGAVLALVQSLELARRDLKLVRDLGRRLADLKRPADAERAYTSAVELLPAETDGYALLAEVRQEQGRWADAIPLWESAVRVRPLEPVARLRLAGALAHEKQWDRAEEALKGIEGQTWPDRFGDVTGQARKLREEINRGRAGK